MFIPQSNIKTVKRIAKSIIGLTATAAVLVYGAMMYQARNHQAELEQVRRAAEVDSIHAAQRAVDDSMKADLEEIKRLMTLTRNQVFRIEQKVKQMDNIKY